MYPIISTQEADTMIRLKDNETVILGGLINNTDEKGKEDIPYLKDIPVIGNAFKRRNNQATTREVLIFITTKFIYDNTIMDANEALMNMAENKDKKVEMTIADSSELSVKDAQEKTVDVKEGTSPFSSSDFKTGPQ